MLFTSNWHECGYCDGAGCYLVIDPASGEEYQVPCGVCDGLGGWEEDED